MSQYVGQPLEYTKTNSKWVLDEERKKALQEAIKNWKNQPSGFPAGRPAFGDSIYKPAVITEEDIKGMENARVNLIKAQQAVANAQTPSSTSKSKLKKYVFNQDYEATQRVVQEKAVGDYTENIRYIPIKYKFKKGDVFEGEKTLLGGGVKPNSAIYGVNISTMQSINEDGSIRKGLVTFPIENGIVDEATFLQANRKQLLLLLAVVVGYFAYKKFKK